MKGVVLHGGLGTRLRPLTHVGPKQLIPIANKPMSWYGIADLIGAGIREIALVVSPSGGEAVKLVYGDGTKFGAKFGYVIQSEPLGIADAVRLCRSFVGDEPFVVYLGDNIMGGGITTYVKDFEQGNQDALILTTRVPDPRMFGVVITRPDGKVIRLIEKPKEPPSNLALVGVYFLRKSIFGQIDKLKPSWRGEYEMSEAIQGLVDSRLNVEQREVLGWWKDTGTPNDILEANRLVLHDIRREILGQAEEASQIIGQVKLERGAKVKGNSVLRGPCVIGEDSTIGPNACIGEYTSIGKNVEVVDTEIDNSIVMDECKVSCGGRIIDSIIGSHSKVESMRQNLPRGKRVVVGENSAVYI